MNKLFYIEYSIQIMDGIKEYNGFIYAKHEIEAQQIINQIAYDLKAKTHFIDNVQEVKQ